MNEQNYFNFNSLLNILFSDLSFLDFLLLVSLSVVVEEASVSGVVGMLLNELLAFDPLTGLERVRL